ncbi:HEPN domain-containing protein [Erwinia sp. 9145]|uniref:HEPN domain-containing protein n=1 Tax=Erwinia sp. 9145 TaxID=1500895 RepID=UPI000691513B|nr:HEPN domain-containing protein [Erwinia sp. 9145]
MNDRHINYPDHTNFPCDAFDMPFNNDGPAEFNNEWLSNASREDQLTAVREWFTDRYCDPAQETPFNGREGGYLYIHGGPYNPSEELNARFGEHVPDDVIDEVIEDLESEVGDEWAPITWHDESDFYEYDDLIDDRDLPKLKYEQRVHEIRNLFEISPFLNTSDQLIKQMSYCMVITSLEAYLADTVIYWSKQDDWVLFRISSNICNPKDFKITDVFKNIGKFKKDVMNILIENTVWHRLDKLKPAIEDGLKIELPEFGKILGAIQIRNDIIHRAGHTKSGRPLDITNNEIIELIDNVDKFTDQLEVKLKKSFPE